MKMFEIRLGIILVRCKYCINYLSLLLIHSLNTEGITNVNTYVCISQVIIPFYEYLFVFADRLFLRNNSRCILGGRSNKTGGHTFIVLPTEYNKHIIFAIGLMLWSGGHVFPSICTVFTFCLY